MFLLSLSSYTLAFTFCPEHLEIECISCETISQTHNDKIINLYSLMPNNLLFVQKPVQP